MGGWECRMTEKRDPETGLRVDDSPALRLAARDWRSIASMRHPAKVALWLALMKPAHEVLARAKDGWQPDEEGDGKGVPAIIALGEAMLARALAGDPSAASQIADRIEGKVGPRAGDVDPAVEVNRATVAATIESLVRVMTASKLGLVVDVDVIDETPIAKSGLREDNAGPKKPNGSAH